MIPVLIQDYIEKTCDAKVHIEKRQFYYDTLVKINKAITDAIKLYETESKSRK
jgi:hypothetical protein